MNKIIVAIIDAAGRGALAALIIARSHRGYGTEIHRRAINRYGFCSYHRKGFVNL